MVANQGKITNLAGTPSTGLVDGTDKLHSGILKTLESFSQGDMCISHAGFTITDAGTYTQYNLAQPIKFTSKGQYVSYTSGNLTVVYSSTVADASNDRYDWVLLNPNIGGTPSIVIVQGTAASAPLVADITAGYIPIALVKIDAGSANDATSRNFQLYTMSKVSNSLSIGYNNSGYTESGSVTGDTNGITMTGLYKLDTLPTATVAADDKIILQDTNDSDIIKTTTAASIGALGSSVSQLNDLSDVSYSSGDLTITSLDKVVFANGANSEISVASTGAGTDGRDLTISAGSAPTGSANQNGGDLHLKAGSGDGTGTSIMTFSTKINGTDTVAEQMRIHSDGKVGIGTNAPDTELHVTGAANPTITVQETGQTGHVKITSLEDAQAQIIAENETASETCSLNIDAKAVNGYTQEVRIFRNSNSNSDGLFIIKQTGTNNNALVFYSDKDGTAHQFDFSSALRITAPSSDVIISNIVDDKDLIFSASTSSATNEIMRVDSTQQAVSIGTATSNAKLTVDGDISRKGLIRNITLAMGTPLPSGNTYVITDTDDYIKALAPSGFPLELQLPDAGAEDIGRTYRIVAVEDTGGLTLTITGSSDTLFDPAGTPITQAITGTSNILTMVAGKVYDIICSDADQWTVITLN